MASEVGGENSNHYTTEPPPPPIQLCKNTCYIFHYRYVDRLVSRLKVLLSECEKQRSLARLMVTRRAEAAAEQVETEPKVELMRRKMKELQGQVGFKGQRSLVRVKGQFQQIRQIFIIFHIIPLAGKI